ncbi:S1 RNA-binding domain-containing protein [Leptolyngbya sp. 15MV]|nr:S1 RNA-binding domain-containing protein [Leptolyngbya sp. 15MV]
MSAEIDAAMRAVDSGPMPSATRPSEPSRPAAIRGPRVVQAGREQRSGKVVSVGPTDVFLEFGPKDLGVIPRTQFTEETLPKVGDALEVVVTQRDADGLITCSLPGAVQKADWEMLEPGTVVEAKVVGVNKGGLDLEVAQHRAFMPAGQVGLEHIPDLSVLMGEKLKCAVMRVDRAGRGNIVLSRKEILLAERKEQAERLKRTLAEGQVLEGTVRKVMAFGAFVDLGGVDGLVHVSDLTHDRVGHGENFVRRYAKEGDRLKVQVLKVDLEANRISLGIKQVSADPFALAANEIKEGAEVTGKVTNIAEFGAFIELAPGVEGLVHISELAWKRVGRVEDVVKKDEIVKAKVIKIDTGSRRISLSIKALTEQPAPTGGVGGGGDKKRPGRSVEEIQKVTPELRRLREKAKLNRQLKGGI